MAAKKKTAKKALSYGDMEMSVLKQMEKIGTVGLRAVCGEQEFNITGVSVIKPGESVYNEPVLQFELIEI